MRNGGHLLEPSDLGGWAIAGVTCKVVEIFNSEQSRWKGSPLYDAIVRTVAREKSAARCIVTRAVAGCFENGEVASHRVLHLSHNMPLKIEIILPGPELDRVLDQVKMVTECIVVVEERDIRVHRTTGGPLPRGLLVRDVMTATPISVSANSDLRDVLSVPVRSEFDGVPVTDKQERLVGMITQDDLVGEVGMHVKLALLAALR
jgi:PII-like signaling protein